MHSMCHIIIEIWHGVKAADHRIALCIPSAQETMGMKGKSFISKNQPVFPLSTNAEVIQKKCVRHGEMIRN